MPFVLPNPLRTPLHVTRVSMPFVLPNPLRTPLHVKRASVPSVLPNPLPVKRASVPFGPSQTPRVR